MHCSFWERIPKAAQLSILWTKVMPPLRYTVGFIDCNRVDIVSVEKSDEVLIG